MPTTRVADDIRQALTAAGQGEVGGDNVTGFRLWRSQRTAGVVYVECRLHPDRFDYRSTLRWGNDQIGRYADALKAVGFSVARQQRAGVDRLMVMKP